MGRIRKLGFTLKVWQRRRCLKLVINIKLLPIIPLSDTKKHQIFDLSHNLKNLKPTVFAKFFKNANMNGSIHGVGNNNKLFIIKHVQSTFRYFAREIPPEQKTYKVWKSLLNKMFSHLHGDNKKKSRDVCSLYGCPKTTFFGKIDKTKAKMFATDFKSEFFKKEHFLKFKNCGNTSCIKAFHNSLYSRFLPKNTPLNIATLSLEAKIATAIIHHNENKEGFLKFGNAIPQMQNWPVSPKNCESLIKMSVVKQAKTKKYFYKRKAVNFERLKSQKQFSDITKSDDGVYKPSKTIDQI